MMVASIFVVAQPEDEDGDQELLKGQR